ncbi:hypothetical protein Tsubulata_005853 [Turnera subulata]|uniref:Response regulatory domain-containing protein n=1 Tax=Turnera subulata TaxID=218843 RepID=A0A9Q0JGZ1_9ROSI|nr:hypothetical protein Tsubulata_005853 [Turnera subulata]
MEMALEKGMCSMKISVDNGIADEGKDNSNNIFSVLIVDDCSVIRTIHKMFMTNLGMEVQVANDGKEAIELHRSGASFELILMDMEMPIMNGPEATRELRATGVNSPIIGITSCTSEPAIRVFMEAGLNDCVEKPLTIEKISHFLPPIKTNTKDDN